MATSSSGENSSSAAEQAAALSDAGNAHLEGGRVEEAQACFEKAMALQDSNHQNAALNGAPGNALADDGDDWELSDLDEKLGALAVSRPAHSQPSTPAREAPSSKSSTATSSAARGSPARRALSANSYQSPQRPSSLPSPVARGATDVLPYDGRHILELHGYSSATSQSSVERYAQDLNSHSLDPAVRFVDDTTALAIFANPAAASEALSRAEGGQFKVQAFCEAKEASKQFSVSELRPPAPRPQTSAATARRLIGAALGAPGLRDKAAEQSLREQRRESKNLKAEGQRMADAAWDD